MTAIQFETIVIGNTIRIPDQFATVVPKTVKVTLMPASESKIKFGTKSKAGMLSEEDFVALKIDTLGFKFNREEANER